MTRNIVRTAALAGFFTTLTTFANRVFGTWFGNRLARVAATHVRGNATWHSSPGAYGLLAGIRHD